MLETVNEPISVLASFGRGKNGSVQIRPHRLSWRGRRYNVETFGLYHPERRGNKRVHIFSFSSGPTAFRIELDPDSLEWTLTEVYYEGGLV
jgi:hypothetical protein